VDQGNGRYAAFLSYSHKDAAAARWLHRRLETYRIPKRLVGAEGEWGPVPARLTPIFRDREELPAAGDLSERVRAALALSDNLVIVCSPAAAASPWVAKEIAAFRELHPGRPVFAAIVEGDPPLCFPPSLAAGGAEPLAADLRPGRDGRRLGFLKLVAGLSGTGLDTLVQRDAQRRLRRVTAVTAAALAAMLVMVVMTAMALSERREAQRQRAEAEGLVEFMLTDLRNRLKGVGRLDVMEAVNRRAIDRYRQQDLRRFDTDALERRARLLQAMGEDDEKLAQLGRAMLELTEAHRTTKALLAREPDNPKYIYRHGESEYWIGRIHELRQDWPAAQRQYLLFTAAASRAAAAEPNNPDYMMAVAWSAIDLGNVQLNGAGDLHGAQHSYEKAIDWFHRATHTRPADEDTARALANAYGWLADSFFRQSLWRQSLESRSQQYKIVKALYQREPTNFEDGYRLALAERALALSLGKVGDAIGAWHHASEALRWSKILSEQDPRNAEWLLFRAFVGCDLYFAPFSRVDAAGRDGLGRDVEAAAKTLRAGRNPRVSELSRCLKAMDKAELKMLH
jgi:tetratricopeptide (TPR) repeat protein